MNPQQVLIGIGSNLDDPKKQVSRAIAVLNTIQKTRLLLRSSLYSSSPRGPQDQNNFVNAATLIETYLNPAQLLNSLQTIESDFGRLKKRRWGERIIDLDIVFFGQQEVSLSNPNLTIPHAEALLRDFVMVPCLEICPEWRLPNGKPLRDYSSGCETHNLHQLG
jgi:2-amino-4-hydroxy-6-hydroxymethyldihydropteridine diphosphokinase